MALTDKKYEKFYKTTGTGDDKADSSDLAKAEVLWDSDRGEGCKWLLNDSTLGPIVFQLQQLQDELDYLRTEISANKDKAGISNSQASAITANTAKTGITTQQATLITDNRTESARLDGLITTNTNDISTLNTGVVAAIKVGAYPSLGLLAPAGTTQSHTSEIVYDALQKKYFLNIYYKEETPAKPPKKGVVTIRTGQIELK